MKSEIEIKKINTDSYHPEHKYMARYRLTLNKFLLEYGRTKKEAEEKLLKLIKEFN